MFRHRRCSILLAIWARWLHEVSEQNFVDGNSEGIYKDSERDFINLLDVELNNLDSRLSRHCFVALGVDAGEALRARHASIIELIWRASSYRPPVVAKAEARSRFAMASSIRWTCS